MDLKVDIRVVLLMTQIVKLSLSLSILYLSLNLSLSLRDRDRADTVITFQPHHPHHTTENLLRVDLYSSVIHHWNRQLKPYSFPLKKIGLIRVTYDPLSVLGLINI